MPFVFPDSMGLTEILSLAVASILVNNYILVQFLGCCSFFGVSKKTDTAIGMGMAVVIRHGAGECRYLGGAVFHPRTAGSAVHADHRVHSGHRDARAVRRDVHEKIHAGPVFGARHLPAADHHQLRGARRGDLEYRQQLFVHRLDGLRRRLRPGLHAGDRLFSSIRERLDATSKCPKCFEGFPIALVSAALLAMSFMGFSGLSIW